jgi:hypothetical protein
MAFLAAMEGLESRLSEMAIGDSSLTEGLKSAESAKSKEAALIDLAAKHGFLSCNEKKRLHALREMRNDYAHASQLSPQPYEVELAVRTAVDLVLSRPAQVLPGRAKSLARELATDVHRLASGVDAENKFAADLAPLVHRSARPVMFRELLLHHIEAGQVSRNLTARVVNVARNLLARWRPDLSAPEWRLDLILTETPGPAAEVLIDPQVWTLIPVDYRSRVLGASYKHESNDLRPAIANVLRAQVDPESEEMFLEAIRKLPLHDWPESSVPPLKELLPTVLNVLNGNRQQEAKWTCDRLVMLPAEEFARLTVDECGELVRALEKAGDPGGLNSWGVRAGIRRLADRADLPQALTDKLINAQRRIEAKLDTSE